MLSSCYRDLANARITTPNVDDMIRFVEDHRRLLVLTGAGVSTGSGIPDYRDVQGNWKRPSPVQFRDFVADPRTRQRYWARSLVGWPWFRKARPNANHQALVAMEAGGRIQKLVTQNVDRLHQRAGSRRVIDLHGRLDRVVCLDCGALVPRAPFQKRLSDLNATFAHHMGTMAPDGDAYLEEGDFGNFQVPGCERCGGTLKPDVVFFGEGVPRDRVAATSNALLASDGLLVLGSSLMVYSGFRFCRMAAQHGIPMAAVNLGRTRADDLFDLKVEAPCEAVLPVLRRVLAG
jgi:NAD-dependent SIR2 family protein deacetylase